MTTVLVVDDEEGNAALVNFKLKRAGFKVIEAGNGKLGIELARGTRPDLIVLDVMMPDMNGLETLSILKADCELRSIPVILLTAVGTEKDILRGFELGADDYITKPFNTNVFLARVKALLSRTMRA